MMLRRKRLMVMAGIVLVLAILCIYFYFDPTSRFFPSCPFLSLTGLECPGCGSQRALHALLHGDIVAVWHLNAALFVFVPLLIALFVAELLGPQRAPRLYTALNSRYVIWGTAVFIIVWWVVRNVI
ncbi:MAG: DUF2752 domain-containing protein [Muribaculaceae bacterium]|nr:DUF2752 domain-containing protein [Muribaculaceae bacterium]